MYNMKDMSEMGSPVIKLWTRRFFFQHRHVCEEIYRPDIEVTKS